MLQWRIRFMCHYANTALTPPDDGCISVRGEITVEATCKEQAVQLAQIRLSRLGYNRIVADYEDCESAE